MATIDVYQLLPSAPFYEQLQEIKCNSDVRGLHFFHDTSVDPAKVEIARTLRAAKNSIVPISWTLPRRRKEFFQDDLYIYFCFFLF